MDAFLKIFTNLYGLEMAMLPFYLDDEWTLIPHQGLYCIKVWEGTSSEKFSLRFKMTFFLFVNNVEWNI